MLAFVRRRPVASHFILSFLIASAVVATSIAMAARNPAVLSATGDMVTKIYDGAGYINIASIGAAALRQPVLFLIFAYALAPTIAALAVASTGAGGGLGRLLSRLAPVGANGTFGRSLILYGGLLAFYVLGLVFYAKVAGPGVFTYWRLRSLGGSVAVGAIIGLFLDEGGTCEELGWRGFEWPNLRASMRSPVAAVLTLGCLHWAWHLPREAISFAGGVALTPWLIGQASFLLLCLCLAIVAVFCVNQAGGSVWPAVFVHGGSNLWTKATTDVFPNFGFLDPRLVMVFVAAALILLFGRRGLARGKPPS